jgi:hypothetical protein
MSIAVAWPLQYGFLRCATPCCDGKAHTLLKLFLLLHRQQQLLLLQQHLLLLRLLLQTQQVFHLHARGIEGGIIIMSRLSSILLDNLPSAPSHNILASHNILDFHSPV